MKQFGTYQYIGDKMNTRDTAEVGSVCWNEGKWTTFVQPHIPTDYSLECQTLTDVGCNAGLFLKLAKNFGFGRVVGIEPDTQAYARAIAYRDKHNFDYEIINKKIEECELPLSNYVIFVNSHYYLTPAEWKRCIAKLEEKTQYVIIVTAEKKPNIDFAPSDITGIRKDFKTWQEMDIIDIPKDNTPHSRHLTSICFKNNELSLVSIDSLDNGNSQQRDFLKQLDEGVNLFKTDYYRRLKSYRRHTGSRQKTWTKEELTKYMHDRVALYEDVKKNGMFTPIEIDAKTNRITDGNHRCEIMRHLGYQNILVINK